MKVLAFAASASAKSINNQFAIYAANQLGRMYVDVKVDTLNMIDYELPLFNEDREAELGQPDLAKAFLDKIAASDAVIISFAEYNGSYAAAYKNTFDWASRINQKVFQNKPMIMLATSPGPGGAASVLAQATNSASFFAADVKASISLPAFYDNFDIEKSELKHHEVATQLTAALHELAASYTGQLLKAS